MRGRRETSDYYSVSSSRLTNALMVSVIHNWGDLSHA